jgi:hypothetical protein
MAVAFMVSIWALAGIEGDTITEDPKDLRVGDSSDVKE